MGKVSIETILLNLKIYVSWRDSSVPVISNTINAHLHSDQLCEYPAYVLQVQIENKYKEIKVAGRYFCKIKFVFILLNLLEVAKGTKSTKSPIIGPHNSSMELHDSIKKHHLIQFMQLYLN